MRGLGGPRIVFMSRQAHTQPARDILHVLPRHAAGARAARRRPFERFPAQRLVVDLDLEVFDVTLDHRKEFVLAAAVEAEPQAEPVGQRNFFLNRFARIDRGRALVLDHVARQEMAAVRGRVKDDVLRPAFDAAFKYCFKRFVRGVVGIERKVVAEHDEAEVLRAAHHRHQVGQAFDILAMNFDELQRAGVLAQRRR